MKKVKTMKRNKQSGQGMRGWTELCSDMNWEDYHGMWCKKAKDGSFYVLRWTNLLDAGGSDFEDQPYECEVRRIDFSELPSEEVERALRSCGYREERGHGPVRLHAIVNEHDGSIVVDDIKQVILVKVECCIQYGLGAPLETFLGKVRPKNLRATARRYAEELMKDAKRLEERLDRPVNNIGSTAREYGKGDLTSALLRDTPGTDPVSMRIMRKMHGIVEVKPEPTVVTGTLHPDGSLSNVRHLKHSDLKKCPFFIFLPDHYRDDGSCKCDDAEERKRLIESADYSEADFAGIPLRAS